MPDDAVPTAAITLVEMDEQVRGKASLGEEEVRRVREVGSRSIREHERKRRCRALGRGRRDKELILRCGGRRGGRTFSKFRRPGKPIGVRASDLARRRDAGGNFGLGMSEVGDASAHLDLVADLGDPVPRVVDEPDVVALLGERVAIGPHDEDGGAGPSGDRDTPRIGRERSGQQCRVARRTRG